MIRKYSAIAALAVLAVMALLRVNPNAVNSFIRTKQRRALSLTYSDFLDEQYYDQANLRLVTFGTSRGYGSGMANPATESFTGLLNGTNLAIRASTADYPAMCTYSMVNDNIYDVIVIEYLPQSYHLTKEALVELGKRLRQRFPEALIIYVDIWSNHQFQLRLPGNNVQSAFKIAEEKAIGRGLKSKDRQAIKDVAEEHKNIATPWNFLESDSNWLRETVQDPATIGAKVLGIDLPTKGNEAQSFDSMIDMYLDDGIHFSKFGHQYVQQGIQKIIREAQKERSDKVNEWALTDSCENWIQTGKTKLITNMGMVPFSNGKKYALESFAKRMEIHKEPNYIVIDNKYDKVQHLYLSHMSSGPADFYGGGTAEICDKPHNHTTTHMVSLDTLANYTTWQIHVIKHEYIGEVQPGVHFLVVENKNKEMVNLRITGLILTPEIIVTEHLAGNVD